MHAIYVRDLESRRPGVLLAVDIEDAALAERLVRSIACSYPKNGCDETQACWFRDGRGLHRIWSAPLRGAGSARSGDERGKEGGKERRKAGGRSRAAA